MTIPQAVEAKTQLDRFIFKSYTPEPAQLDEEEALPIGLLGSLEIAADGLADTKKWRGLLSRNSQEQRNYSSCDLGLQRDNCSPAVRAWRQELEKIGKLEPLEQLRALNKYANRQARYADDLLNFGARDHWATPIEFLKGYGDCEDYAFFKFASLLELGFEPADVRLVIVKNDLSGSFHAIATAEIDGEVHVLDSLDEAVTTDDTLLRYRPVRSFSVSQSYMHIVNDQIRMDYLARLATRRASPVRLSRIPVELEEPPAFKSYRDSRLLKCQTCGANYGLWDVPVSMDNNLG